MLKVSRINEKNKHSLVEELKDDVVRHVFAVNDLENEPQYTTMYTAHEDGDLKGYILIYTRTEVPSTILECENECKTKVAETLLKHAPTNHFILHTQPNLLLTILRRFPNAKHYIEDWMLVKKGNAHFYRSESVRRLSTEKDAAKLANLLSSQRNRPATTRKKCLEQISRMPIYGFFQVGQLVSYAGSFIQLPQIWLIGGVYTDPVHRNKGYATLATSAITEEALQKSEKAALFARSDNYPAVKAYEKIGYRKIGEKVWIDVGTGMHP
jgi:ribosomal protein S18 acetylase RimI-like enzyme